jgi:hypothetical protein
MDPIIETWQIHNRINLYLLEAITEDALTTQSASKGRTVGQQFAHMHSVRMMWLKVAAPQLLEALPKIEKEGISKAVVSDALTLSANAISQLFELSKDSGKIKGFKPHATAFFGLPYFTRVASQGTNYVVVETVGAYGRSKNPIWPVGVGCEMTTPAAGYSGTPLAKKLSIKEGFTIRLINAPDYYFDLFTDLPINVTVVVDDAPQKDFIHFFTKDESEYTRLLPRLKKEIKRDGMIWVSWPKKSSKVATDITEDKIRNYALQTGLVDIKVCAVAEIWSGLKLVIPVKDR